MDELEFYNGQRSGEEIDELAIQSDLASIHATGSTNTTGATIAAGTYFYLNGVLVRAKAAIANGATFTENTNYETVTAGALNYNKDTGWMTLNTYLRYRKIGDVVYVEITSDSYTPSTSSWVTLGTLPSGYRPNVNVRVCLDYESSWWANVAVYSTGEVRALGNLATYGQLSFAI